MLFAVGLPVVFSPLFPHEGPKISFCSLLYQEDCNLSSVFTLYQQHKTVEQILLKDILYNICWNLLAERTCQVQEY